MILFKNKCHFVIVGMSICHTFVMYLIFTNSNNLKKRRKMRNRKKFSIMGLLSMQTILAFVAGFATRNKIVEKVPSLEKISI